MEIKIVKSLKDFLDSIENNRDRNFGNLHWYRAENSLFNRTLLMPNLFRICNWPLNYREILSQRMEYKKCF